MPSLDLRSIVFAGVAVEVVCILVLVALWRQTRRHYPGLGIWALNATLQAAGLFLILLRDVLPVWASVSAANVLLFGGTWLGLVGLERFVGRRRKQIANGSVVGGAIAIHLWLTYVQPNLALRSAVVAAVLLFFSMRCSTLTLREMKADMRPVTRWVGVVFALFAGLFAFRIANMLGHVGRPDDYLRLGSAEALFHLAIQMLFILLTYAVVLMVNRRLLLDLSLQREKFSKAFHSAPYALLLTRLSDGRILEINDGFTALAGYGDAEALGVTTLDLSLWTQTGDRDAVVAQLAAHGRVDGLEFTFRKKTGERLTGLFSAVVIAVGDEPCILSSIADITARKRTEEERERLVAEREKALAEIKILGGLLPICMSCKKIRDDKGYWNQIEGYIRTHSQAEFSHGLCPDCALKMYPDYRPPPDSTAP